MDRLKYISSSIILFSSFLLSCVDPYDPKIEVQDTDYLIIHGHINSKDQSVTVNLTRTVNLSDTLRHNPEIGASVVVEDLDNHRITLKEISAGVYFAAGDFDYDNQYRLLVTTENSRNYFSEFITLEQTESTESITWTVDENKLELFVSAEDLSEGHKYYRFTYEETFEYRSFFQSHYYFVNGVVEPRTGDAEVFQCWTTLPSGSIILESTKNLTKNIISDLPLVQIPSGDKRLNYKYSLIVKQIAISPEAYDYWYQLRKTTESLGGLFDPIPSSLSGNIKSESDGNVLGFFSGGDVTEERVIINSRDLPEAYSALPAEKCDELQKPIARIKELDGAPFYLTTEYGGFTLEGYFYTTPECADCRLKGGTNLKPVFMN